MQITHGTGIWVSGAHQGDLESSAGWAVVPAQRTAGQSLDSGPRSRVLSSNTTALMQACSRSETQELQCR